MNFQALKVHTDHVLVQGLADADDPAHPWLVEVPIVEGELVSNMISSKNGPMRPMSGAEAAEVRAVAQEAMRSLA